MSSSHYTPQLSRCLLLLKCFSSLFFLVIPFNLLGEGNEYLISCEYCQVQVYMTNCFDLTRFQISACKRLFPPSFILFHWFFYFSRTLKTQKKGFPTSPSPINNTNNSNSQQTTTTSNPSTSLTTTLTSRHNPRSKQSSQRSMIPVPVQVLKNFKQILEKKVNHL